VGWRGLKPPYRPRSLLKIEGRMREKKRKNEEEEEEGATRGRGSGNEPLQSCHPSPIIFR
jgi:hypothetical protein